MNANVGMVHPVAARVSAYTAGSSITYASGMVVSEARGANLSWERSDGRFYGDDVQLDSDNGIVGYTIEFEPTGLSDSARALLLGEVAASDEYSVTDAAAPEVGFGYVRVMRAPGTGGAITESYEAWWFYKLRFSVNQEETRTKERNIEWRTPTLNGSGDGVQLSAEDTLTFAVHKTFSTLATAIAYVNGKAGISG